MTIVIYLLSTQSLLKSIFCHFFLLLREGCFPQSVSLTQRTSPLPLVAFFVKLVTLSYDAHRALTLRWQAMTATSVTGKHEVLCLNELPYSLGSSPPVMMSSLSHLLIHLRNDFWVFLSTFDYLTLPTYSLSSLLKLCHNVPFAFPPSYKQLFTSATMCPNAGRAALRNEWPCLLRPTLSGVCHREGSLKHTNPPTQWPQSLKSVNREADAPD